MVGNRTTFIPIKKLSNQQFIDMCVRKIHYTITRKMPYYAMTTNPLTAKKVSSQILTLILLAFT